MADTNQEKEKRKKAKSAFLRFHKKLSSACGTFENVDEWYEQANELKDLLLEHSSVIPIDVRNSLEDATNLVDTTRAGIQKACESLTSDLKSVIESHLTELAESVATDATSKPSAIKSEIISSGFKISSTLGAGIIGAVVIVAIITAFVILGSSDEVTTNPNIDEPLPITSNKFYVRDKYFDLNPSDDSFAHAIWHFEYEDGRPLEKSVYVKVDVQLQNNQIQPIWELTDKDGVLMFYISQGLAEVGFTKLTLAEFEETTGIYSGDGDPLNFPP